MIDAILPRMPGSLGKCPDKPRFRYLEGYGDAPLHYQCHSSGLEQHEWISVSQGNEHPLTNKGLWKCTYRLRLWAMSRFFYNPKTISTPAAKPENYVPLNYVSILEHISESRHSALVCLSGRWRIGRTNPCLSSAGPKETNSESLYVNMISRNYFVDSGIRKPVPIGPL